MAGKHSDKTEAPTQKRRRDSRREGQVARSPDLVSWILVLIATSLMPGLISGVGSQVNALLREISIVSARPSTAVLPPLVGRALLVLLTTMAPTLLGCAAIALLGNLAQVGFIFTGKPLMPKLSRISPKEGLKRIFSVKGLWQVGAALLRLGVIIAVVAVMLKGIAADLVQTSFRDPAAVIRRLGLTSLSLVRTVAVVCVLVGIADYAIKRRDHIRQLRMTKQEVKQEMKDAEGDPHVRARMRSMRMSMTRNRMLNAIAGADVVITNPTHLAIAVSYSKERGVPKVVARGAGSLAARIREQADRHGVPRVESKPLARTLYRLCRPGEEIPAELYQAVATVLAFLHRLGEAHRSFTGRLHLEVADTWTPSDGAELRRVPPKARARLAKRTRLEPARPQPRPGPGPGPRPVL